MLGIELLPELNRVAEENILRYPARRCQWVQAICADASDFQFPSQPLVVFLFNPLPESGLRKLIGNLEYSLRENPRPVYVVYSNAMLENIVSACAQLHMVKKTGFYRVWAADS